VVTRSGLSCIQVSPFSILPAACGHARATFVLQFVCVQLPTSCGAREQVNNRWLPLVLVRRDGGIYNSVNEIWRSFFGVTPR